MPKTAPLNPSEPSTTRNSNTNTVNPPKSNNAKDITNIAETSSVIDVTTPTTFKQQGTKLPITLKRQARTENNDVLDNGLCEDLTKYLITVGVLFAALLFVGVLAYEFKFCWKINTCKIDQNRPTYDTPYSPKMSARSDDHYSEIPHTYESNIRTINNDCSDSINIPYNDESNIGVNDSSPAAPVYNYPKPIGSNTLTGYESMQNLTNKTPELNEDNDTFSTNVSRFDEATLTDDINTSAERSVVSNAPSPVY